MVADQVPIGWGQTAEVVKAIEEETDLRDFPLPGRILVVEVAERQKKAFRPARLFQVLVAVAKAITLQDPLFSTAAAAAAVWVVAFSIVSLDPAEEAVVERAARPLQ